MRSIMQDDMSVCYLCGKGPYWNKNGVYERLEEHHVFNGNPDRKLSEKYGLKVYLHGAECHRDGASSVHKNKAIKEKLQAEGQAAFERVHGKREDFYRIFRKYYK